MLQRESPGKGCASGSSPETGIAAHESIAAADAEPDDPRHRLRRHPAAKVGVGRVGAIAGCVDDARQDAVDVMICALKFIGHRLVGGFSPRSLGAVRAHPRPAPFWPAPAPEMLMISPRQRGTRFASIVGTTARAMLSVPGWALGPMGRCRFCARLVNSSPPWRSRASEMLARMSMAPIRRAGPGLPRRGCGIGRDSGCGSDRRR